MHAARLWRPLARIGGQECLVAHAVGVGAKIELIPPNAGQGVAGGRPRKGGYIVGFLPLIVGDAVCFGHAATAQWAASGRS